MKEIKFSHEYDKMCYNDICKRPKTAILMDVFIKESKELHPRFIEYNTSYLEKGQLCYYKLPEGKVIILLLKSYFADSMMIWTTIRRFTEQKYKYYSDCRNEEFAIVVTE